MGWLSILFLLPFFMFSQDVYTFKSGGRVFENSIKAFIDKLKDVHENYDKYEQLFAKVKEKKDEYSIEKMASKYLEAYKSLLK